jgi:hypothetical protein
MNDEQYRKLTVFFGYSVSAMVFFLAYWVYTNEYVGRYGARISLTPGQATFTAIGLSLGAVWIAYTTWRHT